MGDEMIREEEAILEERSREDLWVREAMLDRPIASLPNLRPPIGLPRNTPIRLAIERMNEDAVGCVVVVEESGKVVGVFTERDVLTKVTGKGIDHDSTLVGDLMTVDPECLTLEHSIAYALNLMSVGGFRHVPLVDDDGHASGLVGMRHILDHIVDVFPADILNLPPSPALSISRTREGA